MLRLSCAAVAFPTEHAWAFGKSDAWNQKEPSQWSDADRERILTNSPWAKKATVVMEVGGGREMGGGGGAPVGVGAGGPMGGGGGPMGGGGGRGSGGPMDGGGRRGGDGPGGGGLPKLEALVRWESAAPVRMARKENRAEVSDAYLISVSRMAAGGSGAARMGERPEGAPGGEQQPGGAAMERLQQTARLEVKGQPALHPRKVERMDSSGEEILFHFDRAELPITATSKQITFTVRLGPMDVKAKFSPKEMLYKDQLSL